MADKEKANDRDGPTLGTTKRDLAVAGIKGAVGAIPLAGPIISEIISNVIPQQRMERLEAYVQMLAERLEGVERDKLEQSDAVDIFEDGAHLATRALSSERLNHIARLAAHGISGEDRERLEAKRLLNLLDQIDDDQVILLASYLLKNQRNEEFRAKNQAALSRTLAFMNADQATRDRATIETLTRDQLVALNLLQPQFRKPKKGEIPEFDENTGMMKASAKRLTPLGRLLLIRLGLAAQDDF